MPSVTGTNTGGLPILSYLLEWNGGGTGSTFTALIGDAPDNLNQTYTHSGLTTGT